jgi:predicted Zn-dependent peptidase
MSVEKTVLPNGIRVVSEFLPYVECVNIGAYVDVGSVDETNDVSGISHVIEHMMFKGTKNRTAQEMADFVAFMGGTDNAYTCQLETLYHVEVIKDYADSSVELLSDMLCNSLLDQNELEKETKVILEEIKQRNDSIEYFVYDKFIEHLWAGHNLGRPVIGYNDTITSFTSWYCIS